MSNRYMHDVDNQILYRLPALPDVTEQKDKHGTRIGWGVRMEVLLTHSKNRFVGNQLEHPTSEYPEQHFARHYDQAQVISHFYSRYALKGEEITQAEYERLLKEYGVVEGNRR